MSPLVESIAYYGVSFNLEIQTNIRNHKADFQQTIGLSYAFIKKAVKEHFRSSYFNQFSYNLLTGDIWLLPIAGIPGILGVIPENEIAPLWHS